MTTIIANAQSQLQLTQSFQNGALNAPDAAAASAPDTDPPAPSEASKGAAVLLTLSAQAKLASLFQKPTTPFGLPDTLAKSLSEVQKKAADTIAALDQARKSMVSDRKGAAQQKLDEARKKLEMLRMFGGDPKTVARQAKQIAQEIRAAAGEYAAVLKAEGGGAGAGLGAVDASASTVAAPSEQAPVPAVDAAAAGDAVANPAHAPAGADAVAVDPTAPAASTGQSQEAAAKNGPDAARQKTVQAYQDAAARSDAKANKARGEQETLTKFKDAAREAKRLIEEAARKLKAKNPSDPDARDAEKAATAMDRAIQGLSDTIQAQRDGGAEVVVADVVVGIPAGIVMAEPASPPLDILA